MKVIHLADLHLGKPFHKRSLIADQTWMLNNVITIMKEKKAHLVIAGDVFDSPNPSIEAQELFVGFMKSVMSVCEELDLTCIIIVGNHDSNRRLGLWADLVGKNIHIVTDCEEIEIEDISFLAVSFVKPTIAQTKFGMTFDTYDNAFAAISFFDDAISQRNVFEFPLIMAGHIHKRQKIGNIYYPGSLMPYAFGDVYAGGITVWDIDMAWGDSSTLEISSEVVPVKLFRDFQIIRGSLKHCLEIPDTGAYIKVELVDENVPLDVALPELQFHFKNLVTAVSKLKDEWEADLNKEIVQFDSIESALDSFCNQIEVPVLDSNKLRMVQEVIHEITETTD